MGRCSNSGAVPSTQDPEKCLRSASEGQGIWHASGAFYDDPGVPGLTTFRRREKTSLVNLNCLL